MTKRLFNMPLAIMLLISAVAIGAKAQSSNAPRVIATVPFAFTVGDKTLPAGRYTISVLNPSSDRKVLQIRSMNGRSSAMVLTTSVLGIAADNSKLVFDHYDDRYVFARAQVAGDSTSFAALRSKSERKQFAKANNKSLVVIAAE